MGLRESIGSYLVNWVCFAVALYESKIKQQIRMNITSLGEFEIEGDLAFFETFNMKLVYSLV